MITILIFSVLAFILGKWLGRKAQAWAARSKDTPLVEGNSRVEDLAFFASLFFIMIMLQMLIWALHLLA